MRARILGGFIAALLAMAGLTFTAGPAGAVLPLLFDMEVDMISQPATVSAGDEAVLVVTVTNSSLVATPGGLSGTVTVDLASGLSYDDAASSAACSPSGGNDATCSFGPLAQGESVKLNVAADTPASPLGTFTSTATIGNLTAPFSFIEDPAGNSDTASTSTCTNCGESGLVLEGESRTLDLNDGRVLTLTVPQGVPGVIIKTLTGVDAGLTCAPGTCDAGFVIDFEQNDTYKAQDPNNPLEVSVTYGEYECADPNACLVLYQGKSPSTLSPIATCAPSGTSNPSPCQEDSSFTERTFKVNPECKDKNPNHAGGHAHGDGENDKHECLTTTLYTFTFDVLLLSNDPLLPPLKIGG